MLILHAPCQYYNYNYNYVDFSCRCGTVDGYCGPCKNPWNYPYDKANKDSPAVPPASVSENDYFIAGGSSGGSAVAVATGMAFW